MKKSTLLLALLAAMTRWSGAQVPMESMMWKWDTVICYDDQEAVIERLTQSFDNSGHALSQMIVERSGSAWVNYSRVSYTNDVNGRVLAALTELWQSGAWANFTRLSVTYDASGHIIIESVERSQGGAWGNYVKRSYGYDGEGRKSSMLQERWSGGVWLKDLRSTYTYSMNVNTVIAEFSDDGNSWQNGARFTYTCDQNGYYIDLMIGSWEENQWKDAAKIEYINDAEGNILTEWAYNPSGFGWANDSRKIYTYDIYGNALTGKTEKWASNAWLPDNQSSYLYYKKEYLLVLNVPVYRYEATYRGFPLGMEREQDISFSMYPNPATDFITIDAIRGNNNAGVLYIVDNLGKPLKALRLDQDQAHVDVSGLATGLYLVTIKTNEGSATRKLIVQKP